MFCPNCGKEIPEGAGFCPSCGTKLTSMPNASVEHKNCQNIPANGVVLPCPYCGSTDIQKRNQPAFILISAIVSFVVGIIFIRASTLIGLGFIIFGAGIFIIALAGFKDWDKTKWNLTCNTCKKDFHIDPPDGSKIITNIKAESGQIF